MSITVTHFLIPEDISKTNTSAKIETAIEAASEILAFEEKEIITKLVDEFVKTGWTEYELLLKRILFIEDDFDQQKVDYIELPKIPHWDDRSTKYDKITSGKKCKVWHTNFEGFKCSFLYKNFNQIVLITPGVEIIGQNVLDQEIYEHIDHIGETNCPKCEDDISKWYKSILRSRANERDTITNPIFEHCDEITEFKCPCSRDSLNLNEFDNQFILTKLYIETPNLNSEFGILAKKVMERILGFKLEQQIRYHI